MGYPYAELLSILDNEAAMFPHRLFRCINHRRRLEVARRDRRRQAFGALHLRTYLTFAKVLQPYGIEILNSYADTGEWHPATWFLSAEHRNLVKSEIKRIKKYREKDDLL